MMENTGIGGQRSGISMLDKQKSYNKVELN